MLVSCIKVDSFFQTCKSHHIGAACSYSSFGLYTRNVQILYIRKRLVSWDLLSSGKRSNVWHSVKAASKELIPLLTDKGVTDGFQGGILCTNDCSCTSLHGQASHSLLLYGIFCYKSRHCSCHRSARGIGFFHKTVTA